MHHVFRLTFVIISFFLFFLLLTKPAFAAYSNGQCTGDFEGDCYDVPKEDCSTYGGIEPQNICFQVPWTFQYAAGCQACAADNLPNTPECNFKYEYQYNECNTEDRCWGSSTGASGFDSAGRIWPGICSARSFDGSNPNTACISGGHYKQCCSNPEPGFTPATYCSNGI